MKNLCPAPFRKVCLVLSLSAVLASGCGDPGFDRWQMQMVEF